MSARDELVDFLVNYGGRCRDCADEFGFCPQTGIGCGQRRKAVEFILGAIDYGAEHGFASGYRLLGPGELDRETIEAREHAKRLEHAVAFTAKMAWRTDPPNANNKLTDSERLSAIKHHPTIKRYGEPDRELAEKEAAALRSLQGGD